MRVAIVLAVVTFAAIGVPAASGTSPAPAGTVGFTLVRPDGSLLTGLRTDNMQRGCADILVLGKGGNATDYRSIMVNLSVTECQVVAFDHLDTGVHDVAEEAKDVNRVLAMLVGEHGFYYVQLTGFGMGADAAALAAAARPHDLAGRLVYKALVSIEGEWDLATTYEAAMLRGDTAEMAALEAETGGSPSTAADAYDALSMGHHMEQLSYLSELSFFHPLWDGLFPYTEAKEAVLNMTTPPAYGIWFETLTNERIGHSSGITLVSQRLPQADAAPLAGHANEHDETSITISSAVSFNDAILGSYGYMPSGEVFRGAYREDGVCRDSFGTYEC